MMQLSVFKCVRCKNQIKKEELRYDLEGKNFICKGCLQQVIKYFNIKKSEAKEIRSNTNRRKLICLNCTYRFSIHLESNVKPLCPYCGNNNVVEDNFNVERLLKEAENSLCDY